MSDSKPKRDPRTGIAGKTHDRGRNPVRGVRVEESLWNAVKAQADAAGTNRNTVIVALLRGYIDGRIQLPKD